MTLEEANKLLGIAKANYSSAFRSMTQQDKVMLVHSWAFALQDIPGNIVLVAFMQLLTVSKWLPTVAEIRERARGLHYETMELGARSPVFREEMGLSKEPENVIAARQYINENTRHLAGKKEPMLPIDTILNGPISGVLGSESMLDIEKLSSRTEIYLAQGENGLE